MNYAEMMKHKILEASVLLLISMLAYPGIASTVDPGTTYWVSAAGQASWDNCKSDYPLDGVAACPLATANANAVAGDILNIRNGTYGQDAFISPINSGTSTQPMIFRAYNHETVIFTNQIVPNRFHETSAWESTFGATVEHSTEKAWEGKYSTKFIVSARNQGIKSQDFSLNNYGYTFSAWIYSDQPSVTVYI